MDINLGPYINFKAVYDNFSTKIRELSIMDYENYRQGVVDTIKLLGLWNDYIDWADAEGLVDEEGA